jgi:general secretion pathway protein G
MAHITNLIVYLNLIAARGPFQNRFRLLGYKDSKGFTLIELILVTAIIGVIAAMAMPAYNDYVNKAKSVKAKSEIRTICTEINAYIMDNNGIKPTNLGDIKRFGLKDPWGNPYVYSSSAVLEDTFFIKLNTIYDVYSLGRDGLPDTMDEIVSYSDGAYVDLR